MFSWQTNDFNRLCEAYQHRLLFIYSRDTISQYHVFAAFKEQHANLEHAVFTISTSNVTLTNPLLPFISVANEMTEPKKLGNGMISSLIKDVTHSECLSQLIKNISEASRSSSIYLNQKENDLLCRFEKISGGQNPVFVFYGYPFFDAESINLVNLLLSGKINYDFPFLKDAKYIFVCDLHDHSDIYQELKKHEHIDLTLTEPELNNIEEILLEMTSTLDVSSVDQKKLFHLAGGRLPVIEILVKYLEETGQKMIACPPQDVVHQVLNERLDRMGHEGNTLKNILEIAATIGNTFDIQLLKKSSQKEESVQAFLQRSDQEFLTVCNEKIGRFRYDEIWNYFRLFANDDNICEISNAISNAIYYFNPYDYLTRAQHLERAGRLQDACELYFLAYNSNFQEGLPISEKLLDKIKNISSQCELEHFWSALLGYYSAVQQLNFKNALEILEDIPSGMTKRLLLLKEYLIGLCSHRAATNIEQQQYARISIEKASDYAHLLEDGIWCDCQMILISFYVNFDGNFSRAREINKELEYFYSGKSLAPFAQKGLHALERKWSALYSVERAVIKTKHSVDFFKDSIYSAQYLMALNNHSANLIVLGQFQSALQYLRDASLFISNHHCPNVNMMYLLNNYCLCGVLMGIISPKEVTKKITPLLEKQPFGDWQVIIQLNCAIYTALSGEYKEAEAKLLTLETLSQKLNDDYFLYYIYANLAGIYYLLGDVSKAICLLDQKCVEPPSLFKETEKIYLRQRTQQWRHAMKEYVPIDAIDFDTHLLELRPKETQWGFMGRGFLYSDIQFWSEP